MNPVNREQTNKPDKINLSSEGAALRRRKPIIILSTLALLIVSALVIRSVYFSGGGDPAAGSMSSPEAAGSTDLPANRVQLSADALKLAALEMEDVGHHPFRQTLDVTGRLALNEDTAARVGTLVTGRVPRVLATVGDNAKKGQPLVYIHSHELLVARSDEAKARATVTEKVKALAYAKAEMERAERLLEAKALSRREHAHAVANVTAAESELQQARAENERAAEWLEHLTVPHDSHDDVVIVAPSAGVVLKRLVTLGTVIAENSDIMWIGNLGSLWAVAEVPESQATFIRIGSPVEIRVPAFGDTFFNGSIVHIGEMLEPETRTVQVRCLVQNRNGSLRPEMYARIQLAGISEDKVIAVPTESITEIQGEKVVFIALDGGQFEKATVQTGREQEGRVEITGGLRPGQRIVTRGTFFIKSEFLKSSMAEEE